MASTYTTGFGIEKIADSEQSDTWGTTTNHNLDILDRIASYKAVAISGATHTLTVREASPGSGTENLQDGMYRVIKFTGALGGNNTVTIAPNTSPAWFIIENATTDSGALGPYSVILTQGSGANVTVQNGKNAIIYCDGAGAGAEVVNALADLQVGTLEVTGAAAIAGVTTHGGDVVSDLDSTDSLGTTGVRWAGTWTDAINGVTAPTAQYTTAEETKLSGIETSADVTDATNVLAGLVGQEAVATGFTGTLDGVLGGGTPAAATVTTLNGVTAATAQYTTAEETKLSGIETAADVTDATNVLAGLVGQEAVATGFTGTLDGVLGGGTPAAATVTTLTASGIASIDDVTDSTSGTTGSVHTDGGLGVAKALYVGTTAKIIGVTTHGGNVVSDLDSTDSLGTTGVRWLGTWTDAINGVTAPTAQYTSAEETKLSGIETSADVTDATNVLAGLVGQEAVATGFTGTLDGVLGGGTAAAATVTTLTVSGVATHGGNVVSDLDSTDSLGTTLVRWLGTWTDAINGVTAPTAQYTSAEETKLAGIEASADVTDATNVASALSNGVAALTSGEVTQLANIGTAAISAAEWGYVAASTQAYDAADHTKLNGIEALADVTDATNVLAGLVGQEAVATGFTGTLDGVLGGGTPAAASVTTLTLTNDLTVANGGTGAGTFAANGILYGAGTGAIVATAVGTATHVLTSNGAGVAPTFQAAAGGGASDINGLSDALVENNSIFLGNDPSATTSSASNNVAIGTTALDAITTADNNVAVGYNSATVLTTGGDNVAVGRDSLLRLTTGSINLAIGFEAGQKITTGYGNVCVGPSAGYDITTGLKNIMIGRYTGHTGSDFTGSNNIVMGYMADASSQTVSNEITLGDAAIAELRVPGLNFNVVSSTATTGYVLTVDGSGKGAWAAPGGGTDAWSGILLLPANQTYKLVIKCPFAGVIDSVTTMCASGSATATFKINTTALGGAANAISTSEQSQAHSSSNAFSVGDDIQVTISSNSSCVDASFSVVYTR